MIIFHTLIIRQSMLRINVKFPGKVRWRTVQLLIKEVPPAPDCLPKREARRADICLLREIQRVPTRVKV